MNKSRNESGTLPKNYSHDLNHQNIWLFMLVIFIWGASWIGIRLQIGVVPEELSVAYRFGLAAVIMFAIVLITGRRIVFSFRDHFLFLIAGLTMFAFNYLLFYHAAEYVVSGFLALIFSFASIFNLFNSWVFLGERPQAKLFFGALLGILGLATIFLPSMSSGNLGSDPVIGILLALIATYSFSIGNIASAKYKERGIPVYSANAYAMTYGTIAMVLLAAFLGKPFVFDYSVTYTVTLVVLAVFASVVAFAAYVTLIGQIGAPRAGFITIVFPVIALGISTVFEGYQWTTMGILGLFLILTGNVIVLRK